jgi:hypothetical protein
MFFFRVLWVLLSVGIRLAVVAAPLIYVFMFMAQPSFGVLAGIPGYVLAPVYMFVAFFLLFWQDLVGAQAQNQAWFDQLSDEDRESYFRRKKAAEEEEALSADDHLKAYRPGTAEWYIAGNDRIDGLD